MAHGICGGSGSVVSTDLVEDMSEVINHGLLANEQLISDLAIAFSGRDESDYLNFAWAEPISSGSLGRDASLECRRSAPADAGTRPN